MGLRKIDRRLYSIAGWLDKNPDGTYCVGLVFEPEDAPRERSTIYLPETAPDNSAPPDSFSGQGCVGSQHFAFTARLTTERNNRGHLQLNAAALEAQS
jgi:hypothetical protein